jgi:hypothetical protein
MFARILTAVRLPVGRRNGAGRNFDCQACSNGLVEERRKYWRPTVTPRRTRTLNVGFSNPEGSRQSKKPAYFRELIASWYPKETKLEMFAREKISRLGRMGNEVDSSVAIEESHTAQCTVGHNSWACATLSHDQSSVLDREPAQGKSGDTSGMFGGFEGAFVLSRRRALLLYRSRDPSLNLFCASAADFNRLFRNPRYAIISLSVLRSSCRSQVLKKPLLAAQPHSSSSMTCPSSVTDSCRMNCLRCRWILASG